MKTLSFIFLTIGMLFLLIGMCVLFINYNQNEFLLCFGSGFLSISISLLIEKILIKYEQK